MKLKICGLKNNITEVASLLPDYIGFIFWEKSARYFDGSMPELPKSVKKTGVFVNETMEIIRTKIKQYDLDAIQLHGTESPEYCNALINHNIEVIKAFSVGDDFNFSILKKYEPVTDYFLFDTKGKLPGGNGTTFNWEILKNYPLEKPFFLSGGIGPEDAEKIKKLDFPVYAIDINSQFEMAPGFKNIAAIQTFQNQLP